MQLNTYKVNIGWVSEGQLKSAHAIIRSLTKEVAIARAGCRFAIKFPGIQIQTVTIEDIPQKVLSIKGERVEEDRRENKPD